MAFRWIFVLFLVAAVLGVLPVPSGGA
jgi:hypothetical protein